MTALSILFLYVLPAVGGWKVFEKAGLSGWIALIPILNLLGVLRILGRSYLWIFAFVFPVTYFVAAVMVAWRFGKSWIYGIGLVVLPFLFIPMLGFGGAQYLPPARD